MFTTAALYIAAFTLQHVTSSVQDESRIAKSGMKYSILINIDMFIVN